MAHFTIDLMGDEDLIVIPKDEDPKKLLRREVMRKRALEEIFRRAPQPTLEIVPLDRK